MWKDNSKRNLWNKKSLDLDQDLWRNQKANWVEISKCKKREI